ncbi:ABC transporter permease [Paenibacillus thermotolerans]|uniref:ABC transporter permease n=1 Tax=Paenibacillus thermotolerans TaxID=3027807 RepID=UPI0023689A3C|nr:MULTISPECIES: ABC transporter permease subunit [unclassified Paenibacillus]
MTAARWKTVWKYRWQYAMIFPGLILVFLFSYLPMAGVQIAFRDYNIFAGLWDSPWVGFEHFSFLTDPEFWHVFENTIWITVLKFAFGFPAPIVLAIMLNEVRNPLFKRFVQSLTYMPHFVSWIIVAYILEIFLSHSNGLVNDLIALAGFEKIYFMGEVSWFRPIVVISSIWKEIGWSSIIYLAAIAGIDPQLYDAAKVDGAGKWRMMRNVTLPGMMPTISIMLILSIPNLLNVGFDQIFPLQNPVNLPISEVVDTYVVKTGINLGYFGPAAAIGLSMSVVQFMLVYGSNRLSKKFGGSRLF